MDTLMVGSSWTDDEVAVTVATYFRMLCAELRGETVNKAQHNRDLQGVIARSRGAIEFKHSNISAVLQNLHLLYIVGYKPRSNFQGSLVVAVEDALARDPGIELLMLESMERRLAPPLAEVLLHPSAAPVVDFQVSSRPRRAVKHDFVLIEAKRRELGLAGEYAVVRFEQERLRAAGEERLARQVEHVARSRGDGLGYDVLSFDASGAERFIEVKTTRQGESWPFVATRNEVAFSAEVPHQFHLYRVYAYGQAKTGLYTLPGSLHDSCSLVPRDFDAVPA